MSVGRERVLFAVARLRERKLPLTVYIDFSTCQDLMIDLHQPVLTGPLTDVNEFWLFGAHVIYDEKLLGWPCQCGTGDLLSHFGRDCKSITGMYYPVDNLEYVQHLSREREMKRKAV